MAKVGQEDGNNINTEEIRLEAAKPAERTHGLEAGAEAAVAAAVAVEAGEGDFLKNCTITHQL